MKHVRELGLHGLKTLSFCVLTTLLFGQEVPCIHEVTYMAEKSVTYSLSSDVEAESASAYDLLSARSYFNTEEVSKCIDAS